MSNVIERYPLKARVDLTGLINNLGSSYTNFSQPIHELIDNSLSSIRANKDSRNPKLIRITLVERGGTVEITVEDTGSGIADIDSAMVIANTSGRQTTLNEHGQGLKQVIAYIVKNGGDWSMETRGELEREMNVSWAITAPNNKLDGTLELLSMEEWHGELGSTGTIIRITCPYALFATLAPVSNEKVPFLRLASILEEDIRYTYSDAIRADDASFEFVCVPVLGTEARRTLKPLEPNWTDDVTDIKPTTIDLGGGPVTVTGRYGLAKANEDAENHYQANQDSSGAYISINGRIIAGNLLTGIWNRTRHPSGNAFVLRLDLRSDNLAALPETTVEKNGFRQGDKRLNALYRWIRANVAMPSTKEKLEIRLFKQLETILSMDSAYTRITRELFVFTSLGFKDRLDLFTCTCGGTVTAYEGKAKSTKTADVYQLRRYWDGCVHDGIAVTNGILIGTKHNKDVRSLVAYLNTQVAEDGRPYHITLATWADFGIDVSAA